MYKHSSNPMFLSILMAGTLVSISSSSWFGAWMGLEINLLAFIPLMNNSSNLMTNESSIKYFLVQALASSVLIFSVIIMMMKFNFSESIHTPALTEMAIMSSLMMKSGVAPLHFWFPGVMEGITWANGLILMVWQKVAPLMMVSYLITPMVALVPIMLSILIGSLGGLNQTSLRKIMAFSSINHLGWMMTAMAYFDNLWLTYLTFYATITSTLVYLFFMMKTFHINQLFTYKLNSPSMKFCLFFNLLSLGGLPPFLGFLPKWLVIQSLASTGYMLLLSYITVLTLITLFFYLRITFSSFLMNYPSPLWLSPLTHHSITPLSKTLLTLVSILGLPLIAFLPLPT